MEKRHIITRIDRIYRILMDKLRFNIDNWDEFEIIDFYPDLCMIGEWAEDIREEWNSTHPDYIPIELEKFGSIDKWSKASAMPTALSVAYKLLIEGICPDEVRASLSKFVDVMGYLHKDIEQYQRDQQGKLYGVPKELQSDEALRLLDLCVKEDLLDEHYQPKAETKPFQLSLIAQCIGKALYNKPSWSIFEALWSTHDLKGIYIPINKTEETERVRKLFKGINLVNTARQTDQVFYTDKSDESIIKIYNSLKEFGYISTNTTESQFLAICGRGAFEKPIVWIAGVRKLAYFIENLFGMCNESKWDKTVSCFIDKDKKPNKGSLITGLNYMMNHGTSTSESAEYFDKYDKTLRKIVNES
jgi:hypothetical protein